MINANGAKPNTRETWLATAAWLSAKPHTHGESATHRNIAPAAIWRRSGTGRAGRVFIRVRRVFIRLPRALVAQKGQTADRSRAGRAAARSRSRPRPRSEQGGLPLSCES